MWETRGHEPWAPGEVKDCMGCASQVPITLSSHPGTTDTQVSVQLQKTRVSQIAPAQVCSVLTENMEHHLVNVKTLTNPSGPCASFLRKCMQP